MVYITIILCKFLLKVKLKKKNNKNMLVNKLLYKIGNRNNVRRTFGVYNIV